MNETSTTSPQIRVLVVDDSAFMRTALAQMIASEQGFEVVATACCGLDALEKIAALDPDVVTLDVDMPKLGGLETLRFIMSRFPRPVIMVSASTEKDAEITLDALSAGAFDCVPKQMSTVSLDIIHIRSDLIGKLRAAALARRLRSADTHSKKPARACAVQGRHQASLIPSIVALGTSTGGPKALEEILPQFPSDFSVPLLIVQHLPFGFSAPFAQRLNKLCAISVCEASHRELALPGVAYIAPAGVHMRVERRVSDSRPIICLDPKPDRILHIPSVDVLMTAVAENYESRAVGVIMTGMGSDGAKGMSAIHQHGGLTIGQDEASCAVYGMPRICAELGILSYTVPLADIPGRILQATHHRKHA
jgi:two-component system, chemotaxis family, protein-glutamate methylesterase/glutaminase